MDLRGILINVGTVAFEANNNDSISLSAVMIIKHIINKCKH